MRIFLKPPFQSRGVQRVVDALIKYLPANFQLVESKDEADLVVFHAIGRAEHLLEEIRKWEKKPYIVIQYAFRSTMRPHAKDWIEIWEGAEFVWSYYNLLQLCEEDGIEPTFNFYHAPLGVDTNIFNHRSGNIRNYIIATCSLSYLTESVRECVLAAQANNLEVFHLGHDVKKKGVTCRTEISDIELASYYSQCYYVSGLRRVEGFELPAIEGLMCGARPIFFDKPHYRQWFNDFAIFISEEPREGVVASLTEIFKHRPEPVTLNEMLDAMELFNWETIITNFWRNL